MKIDFEFISVWIAILLFCTLVWYFIILGLVKITGL